MAQKPKNTILVLDDEELALDYLTEAIGDQIQRFPL